MKDEAAAADAKEAHAARLAEHEAAAEAKAAGAAKGGKNAAAVVEDTEPEVLLEDTCEFEILESKKYSDNNSRLRSLRNIVQEIPEANFYV
mgnify:CR=1 FL=1